MVVEVGMVTIGLIKTLSGDGGVVVVVVVKVVAVVRLAVVIWNSCMFGDGICDAGSGRTTLW